MKNKRGVTLVALIITIIVMSIIVGITVTSSSTVLQKSKMADYIGYMKLVKARADVVLENELFEDEDGNLNSDDISDENITTNIINNKNYEGYVKKIWYRDDIATQGIDSSILGDSEYFVIVFDESTCETVDVIYSTGCGLDGIRYYTLTDMEDVIN